jgi:hypothetical protein
LLSSAIQCRQNLIVRPKQAPAALVQLDDLGGAMLGRVRSVAFLILMTSIGNHQAWVAVRECGPDFARRLRLGSGADSSASGAARVAGSVNFKRKYAPDFPTVQILEATPHRTVTPGELEALGLVAAPESRPAIRANWIFPDRRSKAWPSYERCLQNAPPARDRGRPDVSRADFTFCLLAIDWGWSLAETAERLLEKSSKARENGEGYARLTTQHAAAAVDRRQRRFDGSGPALGRSRLPDFEKAGSYPHPQPKAKAPGPSAGCEHSFVDARVSAEPAIALGG